MIEPPVIAEAKRRKKVLVTASVLAAIVALVLIAGITFFVSHQKRSSSTNVTRSQPSAEPRSPFLDVPESAVPGRYRWTDGPTEYFIVLYDDHTFMNKDGTIFPQYRWEMGADGLVITWQSSNSRFTN